MKILVLGAGKMVSAILEGLNSEVDLSNFYIYSPSGVSAQELASKVGANWISDLSQIGHIDFVWLGFKPQQLKLVSTLIPPNLKDATYVSFLAALSEKNQRECLGVSSLVRIMPNLNVRLKKGISLVSTESGLPALPFLEKMFKSLGLFLIVKEQELNELTLLTGSGPALIYEFAKSLGDSFSSLSQNDREKLVKILLVGSSEVAHHSQKTFADLSHDVTSKGGVTIAVLNHWQEHGFKEMIKAGVESGKLRSLEISKSINQI